MKGYILLSFQLTGLACIAIGLWMNTDPYVVSYFVVLRRGTTDDALLAASALLLTAGLFIILVGILGCCGVLKHSVVLLQWVSGLHVILLHPIYMVFGPVGTFNQTNLCYALAIALQRLGPWHMKGLRTDYLRRFFGHTRLKVKAA